ncbi:MAG: SpoIIE family protein phosphatase [Spirochaetales bacterium]|nr:SpoIIE family protein phosphatase [Spirochaetales bacterium]
MSAKRPMGAFRFINYIILVLFIREMLYGVLRVIDATLELQIFDSLLCVLLVSDSIILLLYLFWLRHYTGKRGYDISIIVFNIASIAIVLINVIFFQFLPTYFRIIYIAIIVATSIYLDVQLFAVSQYNTENPDIILVVKNMLIFYPLLNATVIYSGIIPVSDEGVVFQSIILALFILVHLYVISKYNFLFDRELEQELKFISDDLESLFEFMRELGGAIAEKVGQDKVLSYVIESTVKTTAADAGAILLIDDYDDILMVKAVSGFFPPLYAVPNVVKTTINRLETYFKSTPIRLGETIFGEVAKTGQPTLIKSSFEDPRLKHNVLNDTLFVSSVILIPLVIERRVLGVLAVLNRERGKAFTENDFEHLKTFGEYAALTIDFIKKSMELQEKKEIEREITIAADIQKTLLPKKLPKLKSAVLEVFSKPAKGVSGDYYDIINLKSNKLALVICDVAGKGVPAAMVMVMIRSILHLITRSDREVHTILTWVNKGISGEIDIDHYATMSILTYDQASKELNYSNAAHHPLLIYRNGTKKIDTLDTEGLPIGIEPSTRYGQKRVKLKSGDIIILYTDGIIEAMNAKGEQYSSEKFIDLILKNSQKTPKELVEVIKADIEAFVGNKKQHDDQTLILMKVN